MTLISDTADLAGFCARQIGADYVTIDTEFMRDRTYWPKLCLVQIAGPEETAAVDAQAAGLDLAPLFDLLLDPGVVKVFHAARQDIEIFYHMTGKIPAPVVDTQVAAMVCGFGDAVSYESLAAKLAGARIDKSSRFTDWSHRPLTEKQLQYALSDVTHLRPAYEKLKRRIDKSGRGEWVEEEMRVLTDPATYQLDPRQAWRRLKTRSENRRFLAVLREVAAWREEEAQTRDLPRNRVLKDESIIEIASHAPATIDELARSRGMQRSFAEGRMGQAILAAVRRGLDLPEPEAPTPEPRLDLPGGLAPVIDLLRVLLKTKCEAHDVAQKLVASADDLAAIAADDNADVPALTGWRRELFGEDALALKQGRLALTADRKRIRVVRIEPSTGSG
ncbi:MAG: ribonuclease D [Alphaproteobacteria bacterium]|nr:MAG: ribonuclease D [Alphaproteobacteria bacterium]